MFRNIFNKDREYFTKKELSYNYVEKFLWISIEVTNDICTIYKEYIIKDGDDIYFENEKIIHEYMYRIHHKYYKISKIYNKYNLYDGHPQLKFVNKLSYRQKKDLFLYKEENRDDDYIIYKKIYYGEQLPPPYKN